MSYRFANRSNLNFLFRHHPFWAYITYRTVPTQTTQPLNGLYLLRSVFLSLTPPYIFTYFLLLTATFGAGL